MHFLGLGRRRSRRRHPIKATPGERGQGQRSLPDPGTRQRGRSVPCPCPAQVHQCRQRHRMGRRGCQWCPFAAAPAPPARSGASPETRPRWGPSRCTATAKGGGGATRVPKGRVSLTRCAITCDLEARACAHIHGRREALGHAVAQRVAAREGEPLQRAQEATGVRGEQASVDRHLREGPQVSVDDQAVVAQHLRAHHTTAGDCAGARLTGRVRVGACGAAVGPAPYAVAFPNSCRERSGVVTTPRAWGRHGKRCISLCRAHARACGSARVLEDRAQVADK